MKMKTLKLSMLACAAIVTGLISCGKEEVPANPPAPSVTVTDSMEIPFNTSHYTFFRFKDSTIVNLSDSASTNWDFGVRLVNIIINSHASGPGNAGVITQNGVFDTYTTAPTTGYAYDTTTTNLAIDNGLTTGWYNYDNNTHAFSPKAGRFFVFRTTGNHYVKMEFISVVPNVPYTNPTPPTSLMYHFKYTYQADGSRNF